MLNDKIKSLLLALIGFSIAWAASLTNLGESLEYQVYDGFVRLRHRQEKGPRVDPRLLVVKVDEKSRQALDGLPMALWLPLYAELFEAAFSGGAQVIGLDVITGYAPEELLMPFVDVAMEHPDQIVFVDFYDKESDTFVRPTDNVRAVLGDHNLGLSNSLRDHDGVNRRQLLSDWKIQGTGHPFFSRLLYERFQQTSEVPREEFLINYTGPSGTIPNVSFSDVLDWARQGDTERLQSVFEGKLVLIGSTAKADQDFAISPFSRQYPLPGVEVHANILNTLLTGQWLEPRGAWVWLALILLPMAWVSLERPLAVSTGVCVLSSLCWIGGCYFAFLSGLVVAPAGLGVLGLALTYLTGYLYRFNTVEKEKRRIRGVFGKYVSPDVMEAMLKFPEDHRPEKAKSQRVTVMFSDINDFSTACEKLEPEEVTRRLNAYFGEMTNIIYSHQGTIIRFIGDEFMVLFGAPKANDKSEEMAVLSAVRMVDRLNQLSAKDPDGTDGFYEVKIGIHVGDMILTSIGNELRSDYNCIGDSTNMAARVLSLTKPLGATVLISEDVKEKVENRPELEFKDLGVHPVKGRKGEIRVYEAFLKKN